MDPEAQQTFRGVFEITNESTSKSTKSFVKPTRL